MSFYGGYPEYISVEQQKKKAAKGLKKLSKKGKVLNPLEVSGKKLVTSELAKLWCSHVEDEIAYCQTRLSKGRSYLRHGSVIHLEINKGIVNAIVSGTDIYQVEIKVKPLEKQKWQNIQQLCIKNPEYSYQLFNGELSKQLLDDFLSKKNYIFPEYNEIDLECNCYDFYGEACKHISAVLYGIGVLMDANMQNLFLLRDVNYEDLLIACTSEINQDLHMPTMNNIINENNLEDLFGIELATSPHS
jgi:uncharacterized Zn finger protein